MLPEPQIVYLTTSMQSMSAADLQRRWLAEDCVHSQRRQVLGQHLLQADQDIAQTTVQEVGTGAYDVAVVNMLRLASYAVLVLATQEMLSCRRRPLLMTAQALLAIQQWI
eukprot:GHRQ01037726.1.p2 GENE.GHRQ01037726.1~~GHRQ01037726.1.p2  ORF type:complete len:110 (+),score=25.01 GHRQ01037726.1:364-693(+)